MPAYQNAGDLFYSDRLGQISTYPEWTSDKLEQTRRTLEELLEKRDAMTEEEFNRGQTNYYWTSYVLRRLGFCHSCSERAPGETDTRPDYTLFYDSTDFFRARDYRGSRDFFAQALAVIRSVGASRSTKSPTRKATQETLLSSSIATFVTRASAGAS